MSIQCKPEPNALTTPETYSLRFVSRNTADVQDLAADIHRSQPNFSPEAVATILQAEDEAILERLLNGEQVTKRGSFSWYLSFTGALENADDPTPPLDGCLHVKVRISQSFLERLLQSAQVERLPLEKKAPLISSAKDSLLDLKNVLNPDGALQLMGDDLYFDRSVPGAGQCVIAGTAGGSMVQTRLLKVGPSEIMLMPAIPAQAHPWNNEYTVSVSARYTEHGSLRTSTYDRFLRSPLTVPGLSSGTGILTGNAATAHVSIDGGTASADTVLRIQVILDLQGGRLLFSLLDMQEGGAAGAEVIVPQNGEYILPGFTGSPASSVEITVNNYAALWDMIRKDYGGRLVDVLKVETTA